MRTVGGGTENRFEDGGSRLSLHSDLLCFKQCSIDRGLGTDNGMAINVMSRTRIGLPHFMEVKPSRRGRRC